MSKHLLNIFLVIFFVLPSRAQWASINIDMKTNSVIAAAYTANVVEEEKIRTELQKMLRHYKSAAVATSGIYASKHFDRKALTNAGRLSSSQENIYYRMIRNIVVNELFPRIVRTADLCMKYPEEVLTWGPYLYKCCEDIHQICMQFECVVTNGRVSFNDITFLSIAEEFKNIFDITSFADVDWQRLFDDMGNFAKEIRKEDIVNDFRSLAQVGGNIATSGGQIGSNLINSLSNGVNDNLNDKLKYLYKAYHQYDSLYNTVNNKARIVDQFNTTLQQLDSLGRGSIFTTKLYDIDSFRSSYITNNEGQYYKQHYYIKSLDISNGKIMIVYDEVFDSYSMNLNAFNTKLDAKIKELNSDNTDFMRYTITKDPPIYYTETDETRVKGRSSAVFLAYCENSSKLGEGNFSWKENGSHNHKDIRDDSREYAMSTSLGGVPDVSPIDDAIARYQKEIDEYNKQLKVLSDRYNEVYYLIQSDQSSNKDALYAELHYIESEQARINALKATAQSNLRECQNQRQEAINEYSQEIDDTYRIPAVMHELEVAYGITWSTDGKWQGNEFIRRGHIPKVESDVIFKATLSCTRGESHFLGVRIHRAILQVQWTLTGDVSSSAETVATIKFDNGASDAEKASQVNAKIKELNSTFPDCRIEVEYQNQEEVFDDSTDELHLLWVSDRIQIARKLYSRLCMINGHLIATQRYLIHRESLITRIKNLLFSGITRERVGQFARRAVRKWNAVGVWIGAGNKPEDFTYDEDGD